MWSNPTDLGHMVRNKDYFIICSEAGLGVQTSLGQIQINQCVHYSRMADPKFLAKHMSECFEDAIGF